MREHQFCLCRASASQRAGWFGAAWSLLQFGEYGRKDLYCISSTFFVTVHS